MSGTDSHRQRKRKRKTRAERNQMSRHYSQEPDKHKKHSNRSSKEMESSRGTGYTLRSGKGALEPSLGLSECRKTTGGTITQGRLTRNLGILSFTNAKSSDWIKRGPIPETEAVKKKVESDMKRILNLAERSTLNSSGDYGARSVVDADHKVEDSKDSDPDLMEVDPPPESSPSKSRQQAQTAQKREMVGNSSKSLATHSSVSAPAEVTSSENRQCDDVLSSTSSDNGNETLEPEPPVQDIAGKILKELKPKFDKMFPERVQSVKLSTPVSGIVSGSASTLSACRPTVACDTGHPFPQFQKPDNILNISESAACLPLQEAAPFVHSSDHTRGSMFSKEGEDAPLTFTRAYLLSETEETEPIIRINVNVDESDDDDNDDILSTARYNAFLASARELEAEQQRLRQLNRFNHYCQVSDRQCLVRHSCDPTDNDTTSCSSREAQSSDWPSSHSTRVLDFSQQSGGHPYRGVAYTYPPTSLNENLYPAPSHHHYSGQNPRIVSGLCHSGSPSCLFYTFKKKRGSAFCQDRNWARSQPFVSSTVCGGEKMYAPVGPHLAQSRLRFQTALNSACSLSDRNCNKAADPMEWEGCDNFLSSVHGSGRYRQSSHGLSSKHLMTQPLSELQTHQADLQRQARTFLDDLDRTCLKRQTNCQPVRYTRHLFRTASSDSNGSPVWMAPVLKDPGLETASFV